MARGPCDVGVCDMSPYVLLFFARPQRKTPLCKVCCAAGIPARRKTMAPRRKRQADCAPGRR